MATIEPNWDEAPKWARYWAVDANGNTWWYSDKPAEGANNRWEKSPNHTIARHHNAYPDWRESMQRRPEVQQPERVWELLAGQNRGRIDALEKKVEKLEYLIANAESILASDALSSSDLAEILKAVAQHGVEELQAGMAMADTARYVYEEP